MAKEGTDIDEIKLPLSQVRRLLAAGSSDAAFLYLYMRSGNPFPPAPGAARLTQEQMDAALALLRDLGLYEPASAPHIRPEPPHYTEADVLNATKREGSFPLLVGEAQRRFGRVLSTEELKILLSMTDYLGLPEEVVGLLITFCIQRARVKGNIRAPSLRNVEKEAYRWADEGIDSLQTAGPYMQARLERLNRIGKLQEQLQLTNRRLTPAEERYLNDWLELGFDEDAIMLAYERTCLNTGSMKWPYCNSILQSWHGKGLHTVREIEAGDSKPQYTQPAQRRTVPAGSAGQGELGDLEQDALARMLERAKH